MLDANILELIKNQRKIGKIGLPQELIRDEEVKVRFTESDRCVVKAASNAIDVNEVQFLYAMVIGTLRKMMDADVELANEIKAEIKLADLFIPHWMI